MRRIRSAIVTGATGAIGTALCRLLSAKGVDVFAVVRPGSPRNERLKDVTVVACDLRELKQLPSCHADAFFHLAWMGTTGADRNDMSLQVENIRSALDAVHAAANMGCKTFIGAGSQAEYGRHNVPLTPKTACFPETGYGIAKLCAGQMSRVECEKLGVDHIWARILSVYGPYDGEKAMIPQVIQQLLAGKKPSLTSGEQLWDYIYADDAAEALFLMALYGRNSAIYPLGSGQARALRTYIEILRDSIDPSLPLGFGEVPYGDTQVMHLEADISTLCKDTGFEPRTDYETGIWKTIDWVRRQHG